MAALSRASSAARRRCPRPRSRSPSSPMRSMDPPPYGWGGVAEILRRFAREGAPARRLADWTGRWWSIWRALDLVPMGDKVVVTHPDLANPFEEAAEISVSSRDRGRLVLANGFDSHGEGVQRLR